MKLQFYFKNLNYFEQEAINFIHSYEKTHNNIKLESIYVTTDKQSNFHPFKKRKMGSWRFLLL
jgi:hypothetical protein